MVNIGVLGGIGPEATGEFYTKLITSLQKKGLIHTNADYPHIIVNSIPAPEPTQEQFSEAELQHYICGLHELNMHTPDFIVMVCNTIHLYYDRLQQESTAPLLDLRKEVRAALEPYTKPLILGSPETLKQGLYYFPGVCEPTPEEIQLLGEAILQFNRGREKQKQQQLVHKLCTRYLSEGVDGILAGCTEFAVMLADAQFPVINTIQVLVNAVIERAYGATEI